jgi:uncharacterized delta-60 repeat protein
MKFIKTLNKVTILIMFLIPDIVLGQAGDLDDSFGDYGVIKGVVRGEVDYCGDIAITDDGTIFITGRTYMSSMLSYYAFISCHNADGTMKDSFGNNGVIVVPFDDTEVYPNSIRILHDKSILVSGSTPTKLFILKFKENGAPDTTFGSDGRVIISISDTISCGGAYLAIQEDEKLLLAGYCIRNSNSNLLLFRFNTDGTIDPIFGTGGIVETDLGGWEAGTSVAIQNDKKIVLSGYSTSNENNDFILLRFNSDGTPDHSFGESGVVYANLMGQGTCKSVVVQPDRMILQGGTLNNDFVLVRYTPEGKRDVNFGDQGIVMTDLVYYEDAEANDIALQPDGKILVAGNAVWFADLVLLILNRYNKDGTLDTDFGYNGSAEWLSEQYKWAYGQAVALQPDNKIIVTGDCSWDDFLLFRFLPGIISGTPELSESILDCIVFPNPATDKIQLHYILNHEAEITIQLLDITGKVISTFIQKENRNPGVYLEKFSLPTSLTKGLYAIHFETGGENQGKLLKIIVE